MGYGFLNNVYKKDAYVMLPNKGVPESDLGTATARAYLIEQKNILIGLPKGKKMDDVVAAMS